MKHLNEIELVMALDGEMEPDELQQAVEHLAECDDCRAQWEKLQAASAMVAEYHQSLYSDDKTYAVARHFNPPAEDTQVGHPFVGRVWNWGVAAVAAMVLLAVGTAMYFSSRPDSHQRAQEAKKSAAPIQGSQVIGDSSQQNQKQVPPAGRNDNSDLVAKGGTQNSVKFAKSAKASSHRPANAKSVAEKPDATLAQFTELPFSDSSLSLNDATVVRVQLPAAALRQAGVAVSEDNATAMLQADLVLGQDGLPRGIRLVKNPIANQAGTN
jgi:hypothetical protein